MRNLSAEFKTTLRSLYEVEDYLLKLKRKGARDRSLWMADDGKSDAKKPTLAAVVSAIVLDLMGRPEKEQDAAFRSGMAALNEMLRSEAAGPEESRTPEKVTHGRPTPAATRKSRTNRGA